MKKLTFLFLSLPIILIAISCTRDFTVESPDKRNSISLELDQNGTIHYSIISNGTLVVEKSSLGVNITDPSLNFNTGLTFLNSQKLVIDETYTLPTGKTYRYKNHANETSYTFNNESDKSIQLICRAYNDGIAFRYIIEHPGEITITGEDTRITIPPNTLSWMMNYVHHYENFYPERMLDTIGVVPLSYPALMKINDVVWMLFTEACVYEQPATHFIKTGKGNELKIRLPEEQYSVEAKWESPWRTFILGDNPGTIVESVLVENLNPPSVYDDMSWIEPGMAVFPWWGNYLANSYIDTLKMYVDLAAEMNWKWIEFDVALVGSPWRTAKLWENTGWLPEFTEYAKSKGINVYGWDEINVLNTPEGRDHIYGRYKELGIKGIKIDYIDTDKQYAMQFRNDALLDAPKYDLMVSFHGETLPRGQRRTYPHTMTLEAVRGAEYYTFKNRPAPTPEHNCTLPFTRNVVGAMDYTPVTFTIRPENPRKTTYAHELALGIIFESAWSVMADRPEAYLNSPAKDILSKFEAAWDETLFISGYPGEFVCLARRKNNKWFIAGINAGRERAVDIPLSFIENGNYIIDIYEDKPGEEMTNLNVRKETIKKGDILSVKMMPNGGFCTLIE